MVLIYVKMFSKILFKKSIRRIQRLNLLYLVVFVIIVWSTWSFLKGVKKSKEKRQVVVKENGPNKESTALSKNIKIKYQLLENIIEHEDEFMQNKHRIMVTITNTGTEPIALGEWTLYFCNSRKIVPTENSQFKLSHYVGCLNKIEPISPGLTINRDESMAIQFLGVFNMALRTQVMPNWYFANGNNEVAVVENTKDLGFFEGISKPVQWRNHLPGNIRPMSPEQRYNFIGPHKPERGDQLLVIPQPLDIAGLELNNLMNIDPSWTLAFDEGLEIEAKVIKDRFGIQKVWQSTIPQAKFIILKVGDPKVPKHTDSMESYNLEINTSKRYVMITGISSAGVFYGIQTLLSLVHEKGAVPKVTIKDAPRFSYRGMHVDVSRHFFPKSSILRLLDAMAMYKVNKFHFHLTDDEAWRLEIPEIPELTQVGSKQCHDPDGFKCIEPQLGSDPRGDATPSYYSVKDYQEILKYANDRHIQVIPEIDFPAHSYAAIKSMLARNRNLREKKMSQEAKEYLLTEFDDITPYMSVQNFKKNTLNPCLESTYRFARRIMESLIRMHKDIQPLTTYHFGGDEVPRGVWELSPACMKVFGGPMTGDNDTAKVDVFRLQQIKEYFVKRLIGIASSLGLKLAGWGDFFQAKSTAYPKRGITVFSWNDGEDYSSDNHDIGALKAYDLSQDGFKVVFAHATRLYFDHPYEFHPEELGNYWATGYTDTRKVFEYAPNFCALVGVCDPHKGKDNVHGISGAFWSETLRTADELELMTFPRFISLAERAWHKASWEDSPNDPRSRDLKMKEWRTFSNFIVIHELSRLSSLGIKYRIPVPGAKLQGKKIKVRTLLPGLPVLVSEDGGKTWKKFEEGMEFDSIVTLATSSLDGKRKSRTIELRPMGTGYDN